jgi:hypothetical protein
MRAFRLVPRGLWSRRASIRGYGLGAKGPESVGALPARLLSVLRKHQGVGNPHSKKTVADLDELAAFIAAESVN